MRSALAAATSSIRRAAENLTYEELLADIRRRDARDSSRSIAPLAAAPDALLLDTTNLDADQVFAAAVKMIEAKAR